MANQRWTVTLQDGPHTLDVVTKGRKITLMLDGAPYQVFTRPFVDVGGDYPFQLGNYSAMLHSRSNGFKATYDLSINGHSVTTNQPVQLIGPTPPWAWVFVVACAIIPIISLGGGVPAALGAGGGIGTYMLSKNPNLSAAMRVAGCVAITVLCWGLFLGLVALINS